MTDRHVEDDDIIQAFSNAAFLQTHWRHVGALQERWLRGHPDTCRLLQQLPIFEAAGAGRSEQAGKGAGEPVADAEEPTFMALAGAAFLAPEGTPGGALPRSFVAAAGEGERAALQLLGVRALSLGDVLRYSASYRR